MKREYYVLHWNEINQRRRENRKADPEKFRKCQRDRYLIHGEEIRACNTLYRQTHQEKIKASKHRYYLAHRVQLIERFKRYHRTHRESNKAAMRRHYLVHREWYRAYNRQYNLTHRDQISRYKRLWAYNLTSEEFDLLWKNQDGVCAICKSPLLNPCVDHDSKTGKVRGLLCRRCNLMIGHAKDNPEILMQAVRYLESSIFRRSKYFGEALNSSI